MFAFQKSRTLVVGGSLGDVKAHNFLADNSARFSLRSRSTTLRSSLCSRSIANRDLRSPLRSRSPVFWPAPLRFPLPLPLRSYALVTTMAYRF